MAIWPEGRTNMSIQIHGKEYVTVAERLTEAREDIKSITTEVLQHTPSVVVKATVLTKKGTFTGTSAANTQKSIEKMSPYEVAETSAVGRALGFAGYGATEGIASADEVVKAESDTITLSLGEQARTAECPTHHLPYTDGKWGLYCKNKNADGTWCKNKPYSQIAEKTTTEEEPPIEAYA